MAGQEVPSQTKMQKGGIQRMDARLRNLGLHGKL